MWLFGNSAHMRHRSEKALYRRVIGLTALSSVKPYVEQSRLPPKLLPTEGKSRKYHPHNSAADTFLSRAGGVQGDEGIRRHPRLERQSPVGGVETPPSLPNRHKTREKVVSLSWSPLSSFKSGERTASSAGQTRGNRRALLVFPAAFPSRERRGGERERTKARERERGSQREGVGNATSAGGRERERERARAAACTD